MKKIIICFFCVISTQLLFGQEFSAEYKKFIKVADSLYKAKEYKKSAQNYSLAFKTLGWKGSTTDRYNAARSWTLANVLDSAFFCLERIAYHAGYSDYDKIVAEEDFNKLHLGKRWQLLMDQIKQNKLPSGWYRSGDKAIDYQMFIDTSGGQNNKKALTIKSIAAKIEGYGALGQQFLPDKYLGKRIKMTGYMKTKDVKGSAGLWLRIENENSKEFFSYDYMYDRPVKGTTDWTKYEIVLKVPENATIIAFGGILTGIGQIWFEKLNFEIVDNSVPLTSNMKDEPNLDFEK